MPSTMNGDSLQARACEAASETTPLLSKDGTEKSYRVWIMIASFSVLLFSAGVSMFVFVEGWDFFTAVYACAQVITTIGYGDFTIQHDLTKLFLCFFIFAGLTMAVFIANTFVNDLAEKHRDYLVDKLTMVEEQMSFSEVHRTLRRLSGPLQDDGTLSHTATQAKKIELKVEELKGWLQKYNRLIVALVPMLADIAFGTVFYALYEGCTCSYGLTKVDGCVDDSYKKCVETGGYVKTWISAFYMSVMTVSTVGIGDYSPRSRLGRAIASVWMILGVMTFAHGVKELSIFFFERNRSFNFGKEEAVIDRKTFECMDKDGNGTLSRAEFRGYFLVKHGLVSQGNLDQIDRYYDMIDTEASNSISYDMLLNGGLGVSGP